MQFPVVGPIGFDVRRGECRFPNRLVLLKPSYVVLRHALARETDAEALESRAKFIKLPYLLLSKLANEPTLVRQLDGKAIAFEPVHRFAHGRRAHLELACDDVRPQLRTTRDASCDDTFNERMMDAGP